eukprot:3439917-Rhodomonas_salina.1
MRNLASTAAALSRPATVAARQGRSSKEAVSSPVDSATPRRRLRCVGGVLPPANGFSLRLTSEDTAGCIPPLAGGSAVTQSDGSKLPLISTGVSTSVMTWSGNRPNELCAQETKCTVECKGGNARALS